MKIHLNIGSAVGFILGLISVVVLATAPQNTFLCLLAFVVLPFLAFYLFTKSFLDTLTLVWLNELLFGSSGAWLQFGSLPARGALLLLLLVAYFFKSRHASIQNQGTTLRSITLLFYGAVFPLLLLAYGVLVRSASFGGALGDVFRFGILLGYFPLRNVIVRNNVVLLNYLKGALFFLGLFFTVLSLLPTPLKSQFSINIFFLGTLPEIFNNLRITYKPILYCLIGLFLALLMLIKKPIWRDQIFWISFLSISALPFLLNALRGPIVFIALCILYIMLKLIVTKDFVVSFRAIFVALVFMVGGYVVSLESGFIERWQNFSQDSSLEEVLSDARVEQTRIMLASWREEPLMGQGVGVPIRGYSRADEEGALSFEVQYLMVLYRTGIIGTLIILLPLLWAIWQFLAFNFHGLETNSDYLRIAILAALVVLLLSATFNPYLASSNTPLLFALYLVLDKRYALGKVSPMYQQPSVKGQYV
jgi:O-Antigen ligase